MLRPLAVLIVLSFCALPGIQAAPAAENQATQDQPFDQYQDQSRYQQQGPGDGYENFSPEQLDNLVSPVALYPDPLLAQLFIAATFPDQVEEAARYVRAYGRNGIDDQDWDVAVRAIAHYPTVVEMMADKIDWTASVGQAYVNQSIDVAISVQRLRHMARSAGNLQSSQEQEVLEHDNYIAINPYQPQYIYVPVYDPALIYYRRPYWGPALTFSVGFPIGAWLNLDFRWGFGGAWGGVYYTGWRQGGWGGDCWNCGWINRSRGRVDFENNIYINNRYSNITVNRSVVYRTINVNNISRDNYIHRDVRYTNVQANNDRDRRMNGGSYGRPGNVSGSNGWSGNSYGGDRRPGPSNKMIDRNIDRGNPRIDQYRGHDNSAPGVRSPNDQQRPAPGPPRGPWNPPNQQPPQAPPRERQQQGHQPPQSQMTRPSPHTFSPSENNFNPHDASQRGQASRQPPPKQHAGPQQKGPNKHAPAHPGGNEEKP